MNYLKRLERLWKIQEVLGTELGLVLENENPTTLDDISPEAKILVDKIYRTQKLSEKA